MNHAIVSSWPEDCVPIYCPTFDDPQGNSTPADQDEWRNLTTGGLHRRMWKREAMVHSTQTLPNDNPATSHYDHDHDNYDGSHRSCVCSYGCDSLWASAERYFSVGG